MQVSELSYIVFFKDYLISLLKNHEVRSTEYLVSSKDHKGDLSFKIPVDIP